MCLVSFVLSTPSNTLEMTVARELGLYLFLSEISAVLFLTKGITMVFIISFGKYEWAIQGLKLNSLGKWGLHVLKAQAVLASQLASCH